MGYQKIENLHQQNKETHARLVESYEASIKNLKEEITLLRELVSGKEKKHV
jgi:hypothetical protein